MKSQPKRVSTHGPHKKLRPSEPKKVRICLGRIETNPKYPGLQSHKYNDKKGKNGEDVWESYVENNNPSACRVFWHYGSDKQGITILLITPHPKTRGKK